MFTDIKQRMSQCYTPTPIADTKPSSVSQLSGLLNEKKPALHLLRHSTRNSTSSQSSLASSSAPSTPLPNRRTSYLSSCSTSLDIRWLDQSHLKPGENASLLSYNTTIDMYRKNIRKTKSAEIQCDFALFLAQTADQLSCPDHLIESEKLLKQNASRGHVASQYYLANMYAAGWLHPKSPNFEKAFPLFLQAAKHHHPDAAYRTAKCYEDGLGTRRDKSKAVQFYRKAATLNHPGAMYCLGLAELHGRLGLSRNLRDGYKWLKRSAEAATVQYPHALHELAALHERGADSIVLRDHDYAVALYTEAAVGLAYAPSAFRLGEIYEFGRLGRSVDPIQSVQFYLIAAEQGLPEACFALTAWYLVGVPELLEPSDEQAYAWALRSAEQGLAKAEYAVGYFYEVGIGIAKDLAVAMEWYTKAAAKGEKRAIQRLQQEGKCPEHRGLARKLTFWKK
ncbi:hypothetical protein EC973_002613 [Apophysomyces ossiformis]|uniref:HCP-like protein n=1 Tax=Apophysomyces ossiformis TaxID=679940 RepID=A0A8H7BI50_9FUNG|nr:hypothetical protein EC973_002613 [Apophysomyces ossiformis]